MSTINKEIKGKKITLVVKGREVKPEDNKLTPKRLTYEFFIKPKDGSYKCKDGATIDFIQFVETKTTYKSVDDPLLRKQQEKFKKEFPDQTILDFPTRTRESAKKNWKMLMDAFGYSEAKVKEIAPIDPTYDGVHKNELGDRPGFKSKLGDDYADVLGILVEKFHFTTCAVCLKNKDGKLVVDDTLGVVVFDVTIDHSKNSASSNLGDVSKLTTSINPPLQKILDKFYS